MSNNFKLPDELLGGAVKVVRPTDLRNRVGLYMMEERGVKLGRNVDPGDVQDMIVEFTQRELAGLSGSGAAVSASPQPRLTGDQLLKIALKHDKPVAGYQFADKFDFDAIAQELNAKFFAAAPAHTEPDYNRAYTMLADALNLNPEFYGLVEMAQVAADRLTGKYDSAQEQPVNSLAASPGPRPVCPKCGTTRIARYMLSFGRLSCPECKAEFHVQCPDDFAQFFPASLNGEKRAPEPEWSPMISEVFKITKVNLNCFKLYFFGSFLGSHHSYKSAANRAGLLSSYIVKWANRYTELLTGQLIEARTKLAATTQGTPEEQ